MDCATCKYWTDYDDAPVNIKVGKCTKAKMFWDSTEWEDEEPYRRILTDETQKVFVQDGSDYRATLLTRHDFGCVEHAIAAAKGQ